MPLLLNTIRPVNLLFCISDFYQQKTKEMLENAIKFLFSEFIKSNSELSLIETSEKLTSIFTSVVDKKSAIKISDLHSKIAEISLKRRLTVFSLKNLQNAEILNISIIVTGGSLEIPQIASFFLKKHRETDGIIAIGIVKKGGTDHNKYVTTECMRGLGSLALETGIPLANAVISVETEAQADERISSSGQNLGMKAVKTCLEMISLKRKIETL